MHRVPFREGRFHGTTEQLIRALRFEAKTDCKTTRIIKNAAADILAEQTDNGVSEMWVPMVERRNAAIAQMRQQMAERDAEIARLESLVQALTSGLSSAIFERDARIKVLEEAIRDVLALPDSAAQLAILDRGVGTATKYAAWLRARAAMAPSHA